MNFSGMKVLSIDPGYTHWDPIKHMFYWTIKVNGRTYFGADHYRTEKTAHQKMRETVFQLRKKHMIGGSNAD